LGRFSEEKGFDLKDGLDVLRPGAMSGRVQVMLSSGLYWLWERWEGIHWANRNSKLHPVLDEGVAVFKQLSFVDSDIHLVFYTLLFFTVFSVLAWLLELGWVFRGRISKSKYFYPVLRLFSLWPYLE
jgi:hypothetical protein